jgi:uncharacterized protein
MESQQLGSWSAGVPVPTQDEKTWGMLAHLSAIATGFVGLSFLGPLLVMLTKGKESAWVEQQAKEALNFQIVIAGVMLVGIILSFTIILACLAVPMMMVVGLASLVLTVMAGLKANNGEMFRYPGNIRLIK